MSHSELEIAVVPALERVHALWLLFGREPEEARRERVAATVNAARLGSVEFEHLLEASRGSRRVGVVWGQLLAGKNANIWPPCSPPDEPVATRIALQTALDSRLREAGLRLAQSLVSITDRESADLLAACGYRQLARLVYLHAPREGLPAIEPASSLQFEPFEERWRERLARIVQGTYVESLDAPGLEGVRPIEEVLEGYRATGEYSPSRWFFVRTEGEDVGCLLLTAHPGLDLWELVYMGLLPAARGRQFGLAVARFALWQAAVHHAAGLLVTVDAANGPALSAYLNCGFQRFDEREVWVKVFS